MKHRFTVIIPTRERADTLEHTLRTVTSQEHDNLEIIVSDNQSTSATRDVVSSARDPRVRYLNTGRRLSMSDNWEFALGHATGDWVTVVGDDDGLLPGCLNRINDVIQASGAEAIRTHAAWFEWPSITGRPSGRLHVVAGTGWDHRRSETWRARVLAGKAHYYELPMLYTGGFVHASVIHRARIADGRFYRSSNPDVYSAMVLSRLLPEYVYLHETVAVFGTSRHSTGRSHFSPPAKQAPGTAPADAFLNEGNIPFHSDVPMGADGHYPKAIQVLVYESYLQVADILPEPHALPRAAQLTVILATAGSHRAAVEQWGRRFAALHGLDFEAAVWAARRYAVRLAVGAFPRRLRLLFRLYSLGSDALPLIDVYAASIAAAVVQAVRPWPVTQAAGRVRARLTRAGRN